MDFPCTIPCKRRRLLLKRRRSALLHFSLSVNGNHRRKHELVGLGNHNVLFFFIVAVGKLGFRPIPVRHLAVVVGTLRENRAQQQTNIRLWRSRGAPPPAPPARKPRNRLKRNSRAVVLLNDSAGTIITAGNTNWSDSVITTSFSSSSSPSASSAFVQSPSAIWP